jgi:MGT family glycosyltransferase
MRSNLAPSPASAGSFRAPGELGYLSRKGRERQTVAMAGFQFVTWDGGGNLPPALGIARELHLRGHAVGVLGEESQRSAVSSAGLSFTEWSHPLSTGLVDRSAVERLTYLIEEVWLNTDLADEVIAILARQPAEALVIDCMLEGVLARSREISAPTIVLVHGLFRSVLAMRDSLITFGNQLRAGAGLPVLETSQLAWEEKELVVATTLREFDGMDDEPATNIRYVGPVLPALNPAEGWPSPWEVTDRRPLVLVSLSTMPGQGSSALAQKVLDALADNAIRVVITTGALPPETLCAPDNAVVFAVVPHRAILSEASLMVTHGGHGSVMGALAHGVPLVCIPGVGADQAIVGARIEAVGAGRLVAPDAVGELGAIVAQVLWDPTYREAARHMEALIERQDGAIGGASAVESALDHR